MDCFPPAFQTRNSALFLLAVFTDAVIKKKGGGIFNNLSPGAIYPSYVSEGRVGFIRVCFGNPQVCAHHNAGRVVASTLAS